MVGADLVKKARPTNKGIKKKFFFSFPIIPLMKQYVAAKHNSDAWLSTYRGPEVVYANI